MPWMNGMMRVGWSETGGAVHGLLWSVGISGPTGRQRRFRPVVSGRVVSTLTQMLSSLTPSKTTAAASSTSFAPGVRAFDYLLVAL